MNTPKLWLNNMVQKIWTDFIFNVFSNYCDKKIYKIYAIIVKSEVGQYTIAYI